MTNTVNVTIRLDRDLKSYAEQMLKDVGMSLSTAITVFLKQTVRNGRIPFSIETDSFWSERNQALLKERLKEAEAGLLTEHELIEVD